MKIPTFDFDSDYTNSKSTRIFFEELEIILLCGAADSMPFSPA
jgi:hypothetical protein